MRYFVQARLLPSQEQRSKNRTQTPRKAVSRAGKDDVIPVETEGAALWLFRLLRALTWAATRLQASVLHFVKP